MFTTTMSLSYAQSVQEEHLRHAQNQRLFSGIMERIPAQNGIVDKMADFLITSGRTLKQRYQTA
jgi:hypothetical protein